MQPYTCKTMLRAYLRFTNIYILFIIIIMMFHSVTCSSRIFFFKRKVKNLLNDIISHILFSSESKHNNINIASKKEDTVSKDNAQVAYRTYSLKFQPKLITTKLSACDLIQTKSLIDNRVVSII